MAASPVSDQPPPGPLLAILNPALRALVGSPLGRLAPDAVIVLRFRGRRTGRAYAIPAAWHAVDGERVVFSSSRWRLNFRGGAPVELAHRGRTLHGTASLDEDPEVVAAGLRAVLARGTPARNLGLRVPAGHVVTADDARDVGRAIIRFDVA